MNTFLTPTADSSASDSHEDRATLTATLFRCMADCDSRDEADHLREQIICLNMSVAESLARRYFGHGENSDDLKQVAFLGLTKAVDGFQPDRGHDFLSYAVPTVSGELKRHFRDHCWAVKPPRRVQDLQRDVSATRQELMHEGRHEPTVADIAVRLGVDEAHVSEAMAAQGCFTPSSIDSTVTVDSKTTLADTIVADGEEYDQAETHLLLSSAISELAEDDREILALRFYEDWTQEQIAHKLGTSQMQISRRLSRLMKQLRSHIGPVPQSA